MSDDLIVRCPFCGSEGSEFGKLVHVEYDGTTRFINCESCGARGPRVKTWGEAWAKWNERSV